MGLDGNTNAGTMINQKKSQTEIPNLTGQVHLLPCCIKYDGPSDVSNYFKPKATGVEVEGMKVEEAYFRGRKLHGATLPIPSGYSGFVIGKEVPGKRKASDMSEQNSDCWGINAKFENITYWNHDSLPSKDDAFVRSFHWFSVAEAEHIDHIHRKNRFPSISLTIKGFICHGILSKLNLFALKIAEDADPAEVEYNEQKGLWRFKPRGLHITWSITKQYGKMPAKWTNGPAELLMVAWLHVEGSTQQPLHKGSRYALSFKMTKKAGAYGWETPGFVMGKVGRKGKPKWGKVNVKDMPVGIRMEVPEEGKLLFEVPKNAEDTRLYFGFYELWGGTTKGGLLIHEAVVEVVD